MKDFIQTNKAPAAIGPYSQAVLVDRMLFVSGQIPFIPESMTLISEDIKEQTLQSLKNIKGILDEAEFSLTDVVKCTVFLSDMNDFADANQIYSDFFGEHKPARCAVEVSRLPKDVKIEIDAICIKSL